MPNVECKFFMLTSIFRVKLIFFYLDVWYSIIRVKIKCHFFQTLMSIYNFEIRHSIFDQNFDKCNFFLFWHSIFDWMLFFLFWHSDQHSIFGVIKVKCLLLFWHLIFWVKIGWHFFILTFTIENPELHLIFSLNVNFILFWHSINIRS